MRASIREVQRTCNVASAQQLNFRAEVLVNWNVLQMCVAPDFPESGLIQACFDALCA
jgi:hypothetical protein